MSLYIWLNQGLLQCEMCIFLMLVEIPGKKVSDDQRIRIMKQIRNKSAIGTNQSDNNKLG